MSRPVSSRAAKPELAVNHHGTTVADALNGFISHDETTDSASEHAAPG